jgi:hypothetical protein
MVKSFDGHGVRAGVFFVLGFASAATEERAAIFRPIEFQTAPVVTAQPDDPL